MELKQNYFDAIVHSDVHNYEWSNQISNEYIPMCAMCILHSYKL